MQEEWEIESSRSAGAIEGGPVSGRGGRALVVEPGRKGGGQGTLEG